MSLILLVSVNKDSLPIYCRDSVQDAKELTKSSWNLIKTKKPILSHTISSPLNKVRATFTLTTKQINKLKNSSPGPISTFVAVSAHLWTCLAASSGEAVPDDEPELFGSPVDCRGRLDPPLPENYFGNCLIFFMASSTHGVIKGRGGFAAAVAAISAAIRETVGNERGVLDGFEHHLKDLSEYEGKRVVLIAGSTRLDPCAADYGWGRAIKYECVHTDYDGAVNLCKGRDGGVEIAIFHQHSTTKERNLTLRKGQGPQRGARHANLCPYQPEQNPLHLINSNASSVEKSSTFDLVKFLAEASTAEFIINNSALMFN
ncbi:hypothetical protein SASPL_112610 [Salvia splendens]|uniref:Uncharacterized protein n=1 Tax=Salvia splendens TaxID=180675 RepID=A0A8X8YB25_SALSN|nr:hypothetical protein SASPL_112610 [Salvia splendens]